MRRRKRRGTREWKYSLMFKYSHSYSRTGTHINTFRNINACAHTHINTRITIYPPTHTHTQVNTHIHKYTYPYRSVHTHKVSPYIYIQRRVGGEGEGIKRAKPRMFPAALHLCV